MSFLRAPILVALLLTFAVGCDDGASPVAADQGRSVDATSAADASMDAPGDAAADAPGDASPPGDSTSTADIAPGDGPICPGGCTVDQFCDEGSCRDVFDKVPLPMQYQSLGFAKPGYDYAPAILWDGGKWVMYHCGYHDGTNSDAIFRSTSADGVSWAIDATPALTVGAAGSWDAGHVCDPSVLYLTDGSTVLGQPWVMWYTAIAESAAGSLANQIGIAVSADGIDWTRQPDPIIGGAACTVVDSAYGCGQTSVVKLGATYQMSHTELLDQDPGHRQLRMRTSTDGVSWTAGTPFKLPHGAVNAEFMVKDGLWYTVAGGNERCGLQGGVLASHLVVYVSATMDGPKTPVGCLADLHTGGGRRFIAEQGFYRGSLGTAVAGSRAIWLAFGLAQNQFHDGSEEIRGARLDLVDAEHGLVDTNWAAAQCSGPGPSVSPLATAWNKDGPAGGDDVVYWTMIADGDGTAEHCDVRLQDFSNPHFESASSLDVRWAGWSDTQGGVALDVYLRQVGDAYVHLGLLEAAENQIEDARLALPPNLTDVEQILFRTREASYTDLSQAGARMRIQIYSVALSR